MTSLSSRIRDNSKLVVVVTGPTAAGKSDVAAVLCAKNRGIIVSADSVQAYKGVQIGANKPSAEERLETPHILVDVADHNDYYNAAQWKRDAILGIKSLLLEDPDDEDPDTVSGPSRRKFVLEDVQSARRTKGYKQNEPLLPLVCGGTMMYIQWLVHGHPDAMRPSESAATEASARIEKYRSANDYKGARKEVESFGEPFVGRITTFCGEDWYRLQRTLEVALTVKDQENREGLIEALYTGERQGGLSSFGYDVRCFFLCPDERMKHARIIDERCEQMIMKGLIKETADLVLAGSMPDMAARAIGYRQVISYLNDDSSVTSEEERFDQFLNDFTTATRQYSKRQMSWFRKDKEFVFVPVTLNSTKSDRVEGAAAVIQKYCQMSREEYEQNLYSGDGESAKCKDANEKQGKKMRLYQLGRQILKKGNSEFQSALAEALDCRQRIQAKRRRLDGEKETS